MQSVFWWFEGALDALTALAKLFKPNYIQDTKVGIEQSGQQSFFTDDQTGYSYRLFATATVNTSGPFFVTLNTASGHVGEPLPNIGSFGPTSREARASMILHELAHLVYVPEQRGGGVRLHFVDI